MVLDLSLSVPASSDNSWLHNHDEATQTLRGTSWAIQSPNSSEHSRHHSVQLKRQKHKDASLRVLGRRASRLQVYLRRVSSLQAPSEFLQKWFQTTHDGPFCAQVRETGMLADTCTPTIVFLAEAADTCAPTIVFWRKLRIPARPRLKTPADTQADTSGHTRVHMSLLG